MPAYYNEINPFAAEWLRKLIDAGHIAPGEVDERSIEDVKPSDLRGFTQCHFFAGIGVWSYALRTAGWPDNRPVWTGSCPCQPFSTAGKRKGNADERHLWPAWNHLINECRPHVIFGEQVEAAIRFGWLDLVQTDLERQGYAFGAVGLPAAGFGAPHIRQRLWFVADTADDGHSSGDGLREAAEPPRPTGTDSLREPARGSDAGVTLADADSGTIECESRELPDPEGTEAGRRSNGLRSGDEISVLADPSGRRCEQRDEGQRTVSESDPNSPAGGGGSLGLADSFDERWEGWVSGRTDQGREDQHGHLGRGSAISDPRNFWGDADWLWCRDKKYRPVEPGTFPLAHGSPARVGRLRGYGNAVCAEVAIAFIQTYLELDR